MRQLQDEKQIDLLNAVFETQETERKRLAEDLHDSVGQVLSAIKLNLHRLDKLGESENPTTLLSETRKLTDECIQEIRNIIHNVLPPVLTDFGLIDALQALCVKIGQNTNIKITFTKSLADERFPSEIELTLYRIAQELFGNAAKHSGATAIQLLLTKESGGWLVLSFSDNGKGFNMDNVKQGFGLKNLQSRVQFINGKIHIYSKPQNGTLTTIKVPLT